MLATSVGTFASRLKNSSAIVFPVRVIDLLGALASPATLGFSFNDETNALRRVGSVSFAFDDMLAAMGQGVKSFTFDDALGSVVGRGVSLFSYQVPVFNKYFVIIDAEGSLTAQPALNVSDTAQPTWNANFGGTSTLGLFNLTRATGQADTDIVSKVINYFSVNHVWSISANNNYYFGDICSMDMEFLTSTNVVKAALRIVPSVPFKHNLQYGLTLSSMINATILNDWNHLETNGKLSFTNSELKYVRNPAITANINDSFTFACDLSQVTKIRVSGRAKSNSPGPGSAFVRISTNADL